MKLEMSHEKLYLSVSSCSLVATAPNMNTDTKYKAVVVPIADNVPTGIDFCVSFKDAERFEPAMMPVTAGKKSPNNELHTFPKHEDNQDHETS
jgi:hypothetical protein